MHTKPYYAERMTLVILVVCSTVSVSAEDNPVKTTLRSVDLMPLKPRTARFVIVEGDNKGEHSILLFKKHDRTTWRLQQTGLYEKTLRIGEDHAILLASSRVKHDDSLLHFTPPVPQLPASLEVSKAETAKATVRVTSLKSGREKARGTYSRKIELIGKRQTEVPAGTFDTFRVHTTESFSFDLATVTVHTDTDYLPGTGPIYRREKSTVTKLGILPTTMVTTVALDEQAEHP